MRTDAKKILKIATLAIFFLFIVGYALFGSHDLLSGVKIKNVTLEDGATLTESELEVAGNAKNALNLTLNGREISVDLKGNFDETIALLPGYNIVSLRAVDKFGKADEKIYKLIYKEANPL